MNPDMGGEALTPNPWTVTIAQLYQHAERRARFFRSLALGLVALTLAGAIYAFWFALAPSAYEHVDIKWAIARLSALVLLVALLLFATRSTWNYSNVWLGRAGTLEDLILALRLLGKSPPSTELPLDQVAKGLSSSLSKEDANNLHVVVQSLERFRRTFEGELLKGPSVEVVPKSPTG
jgi:hypothetical protein